MAVLPTLPTEIWSRVISLVAREIPAPRDCKHWFGLHQNDLCSLMRVNSYFHDLTAPHLYESVVVPDLVALFRNIETIEPLGSVIEIKIIKKGIKTKRDLLAYVRRIQLVHFPPSIEPTYQEMLGGSGKLGWDVLGQSFAEQLNDDDTMYRAAEMASLGTIRNDIMAAANLFNPFPKLEKVIVGGNGDTLWNIREPLLLGGDEPVARMMRQALLPIKVVSLAFLSASEPSHFCMHAIRGPYAPPFDLIFNPKNHSLKSFTVHLDENLVDFHTLDQSWPVIICGTVNRWVWEQLYVRFDLSDDDLAESLEWLASDLDERYQTQLRNPPTIGSDPIDLADTKLDLYAFADCRPVNERLAGKTDLVQARLWTEEVRMMMDAQRILDEKLSAEWRGKVAVKLTHMAQICECCGFGNKPLTNIFAPKVDIGPKF